MTRTWAASEVEIAVQSTIDGVRRNLTGNGEVAIDKGYGDLDWTGDEALFRELINDRAIFTQDDAATGVWIRTESGDRTPTSAFADPLLNLTHVESVTPDGTEEMDGFSAERFHGKLPITTENLEGLAMTDEDVARIVAAAGPHEFVDITVWVDPHHRLVRIDRSLDTSAGSVSILASTHLFNFGVMLDLESPPSSNVSVLR